MSMSNVQANIPVWQEQKQTQSTGFKSQLNQEFKIQTPLFPNSTNQFYPGNEAASWSTPLPRTGNPNPLWGQKMSMAMEVVCLLSLI